VVIREWSDAVNAGDFERAGGLFGEGATIEQGGVPLRAGPREAMAFSASLPCRADVTRVRPAGAGSIATFRLRAGSGGACEGEALVGFRVRDGKLVEWRQLPPRGSSPAPAPEEPAPEPAPEPSEPAPGTRSIRLGA
jgi:hypothetical protein